MQYIFKYIYEGAGDDAKRSLQGTSHLGAVANFMERNGPACDYMLYDAGSQLRGACYILIPTPNNSWGNLPLESLEAINRG